MTETNKPWKYAIVQHPMWLLIAEDTQCAERTPPWGCPSLEEYVERLRESLDSLDEFPQLHLNFDFSAVELEDLAKLHPDILERLRGLTKQGRTSFVNGTYSQPHLQILSVESAIRQFQYGLQSIRGLIGCEITSYAAQEPGLTPQLPQILRAFGFETATGPSFPYGVKLLGGYVQHWDNNWEWVHGDDFPNWLGLDGSRIPIWLKKSCAPRTPDTSNQLQHGLLDHTRLRADILDMISVSPEWVSEIETNGEFCRLDETLSDLLRSQPPQFDAEIDANYAYTEGVDAEALSRANVQAETDMMTLESVEAMLGSQDLPDFAYDEAWRLLLKAQHHDAYWTGGPELRAKSVAWLQEVSEAATAKISATINALATKLPRRDEKSSSIVVIHPYPKPHKLPVKVSLPLGDCSMVDEKGASIGSQRQGDQLIFLSSSDGLAYKTSFVNRGAGTEAKESELSGSYGFSNQFYSLTAAEDGAISRLSVAGASDLLKGPANAWLYQQDGQDIVLRPERPARLIQGPVFDRLEVSCPAKGWNASTRLTFYHELPWFEVETELDFQEPTEIGNYFNDRTKLHYAWPVGTGAAMRHAVGGCPWTARPGRTFFVSPWLDVQTQAGGAAFCLFNATKCWLDSDGVLRFVAAWGHNGDQFHNRQGPLPGIMSPLGWLKPMDIRLRGKHTVRYAVWPHTAATSEADVADWAASLMLPPVAVAAPTGGGQEPWSREFLSVRTPGVVPLSVRPDGDAVIVRMMESSGQAAPLSHESGEGWRVTGLSNLEGTPVETVQPYKIVETRLEK